MTKPTQEQIDSAREYVEGAIEQGEQPIDFFDEQVNYKDAAEQEGYTEMYRGTTYEVNFLPKVTPKLPAAMRKWHGR